MIFSTLPIYIFVFIGLYFQIFMLWTFLEKDAFRLPGRKGSAQGDRLPTVSVTVPCFNEENTVVGTLESLLALDYPKDKLSILVVDDGSTDNTYERVSAFAKTHPQIKLFRQPNGGKYTALNRGIKETTAEIVCGLDADSFVDKDALKRMVAYFENPAVMAVTPAIRVHRPKTVLQLVQKAEYNLGIFFKYLFGKIDAIHITPGPFSLFRKSVFDKLGLYRHAYNTEDMEIAFRMREHHYKIANCPNAFVFTVTPKNIRRLYIQRVRWISGFLKNSLDYRHLFFNKEYGNVSMFILPCAIFSIFGSLYFASSFVYDIGKIIYEKLVKIQTVGLELKASAFHFDPFFINTESLILLSVVVIFIMIILVTLGKKMSEDSYKPSRDMVYFLIMYGFISPLWFFKAVYNTITSNKVPWR